MPVMKEFGLDFRLSQTNLIRGFWVCSFHGNFSNDLNEEIVALCETQEKKRVNMNVVIQWLHEYNCMRLWEFSSWADSLPSLSPLPSAGAAR